MDFDWFVNTLFCDIWISIMGSVRCSHFSQDFPSWKTLVGWRILLERLLLISTFWIVHLSLNQNEKSLFFSHSEFRTVFRVRYPQLRHSIHIPITMRPSFWQKPLPSCFALSYLGTGAWARYSCCSVNTCTLTRPRTLANSPWVVGWNWLVIPKVFWCQN